MGEFSEIDEFMEKDDSRISFLFDQVISVEAFCKYYKVCSMNQNTFFSELYSRFQSITLLPHKSSAHVNNMGKNRYADICTCDNYRVFLWDNEEVKHSTLKNEKASMDKYTSTNFDNKSQATLESSGSHMSDGDIQAKGFVRQNRNIDIVNTICLASNKLVKLASNISTMPASAANKIVKLTSSTSTMPASAENNMSKLTSSTSTVTTSPPNKTVRITSNAGTVSTLSNKTVKIISNAGTVSTSPTKDVFVDLREARLASFQGYINATYIGGAFDDREYIATQGPLSNTINDFYHMLWQEEVKCIVMLCGFVEIMREKCAEYLPTFQKPVVCSFKNMVVELMKTKDVTECLTISILKLTCDSEFRYVTHYHFTGWPDRGVPLGEENFQSIILLQQLAMWTQDDDYSKPSVIHCSAGVGRTGTFLVFDMNVKRLLDGSKTITISPYISRMRKVRPAMVQTEDQFIFAHHLVTHHILTNYLELDFCKFYDYFVSALSNQEGPIYQAYWEPFKISEAMKTVDEDTEVPKDLDIILYLNKLYFPEDDRKLFEIDSFIDGKSFYTTCNPDVEELEEFIDNIIEKEIKVVMYIGDDHESLKYYSDHVIIGKYSIQVENMENINDSIYREINIINNDEPYKILHCQYSLFEKLKQNGITFDCDILKLSSFILYSYKFWVLNSTQKGPSFIIHSSNPEVKNATVLLCLLIMQNIELSGGNVDIPKALNRLRTYLPRCLPNIENYLIALKGLACVLNPK